MAHQRGVPRLVRLMILLPIVLPHLCWCARHANYYEFALESERICHLLHKKSTIELRNATAAIVKPMHMFDRWNVNADRHCRFVFKAARDEGLLAVIHKMDFRSNGDKCLDYVRFKKSDGLLTDEICGQIDRSNALYFPVPEPGDNTFNVDSLARKYDTYAEFDPGKRPQTGAQMETEIYISKEKVPDGRSLDLSITYTPYKDCNKADLKQYAQTGHNICIRKEYQCDKIHNCPLHLCSDEINCWYTSVTDPLPREDTATEVTVGAITTVILCFIIFVMCLWICKRSRKLCWSSDCAGPNVCSRPGSLPQDADGPANRAVPTAPMLEVAVSSPVADKDLPPSYDSLFPERNSNESSNESNPARS